MFSLLCLSKPGQISISFSLYSKMWPFQQAANWLFKPFYLFPCWRTIEHLSVTLDILANHSFLSGVFSPDFYLAISHCGFNFDCRFIWKGIHPLIHFSSSSHFLRLVNMLLNIYSILVSIPLVYSSFSWPNVLKYLQNVFDHNTQTKIKFGNYSFVMVPELCPFIEK